MSPDVKVLDDYLTNGSSASVSDLKHNSNSDSTLNSNNNPSCSIHLNPNENGRTVRNSSPVSDNSQNISIVSLDENDADSSIASDSDFDDDFPPKDAQYIIEKLANGSKCSDQVHSDGVIIVSQNMRDEAVAASRPQIGSIAVQNSSDITFGNKTFYQGPVTIKQFLLDNNSRWRPSGGPNDNPDFQNSNGNVNSSSANGLGEKKGSTSPNSKEPLTFKSILKKYKKYIVLNVVGLLLMLFIVIGLALAFRSGSSKDNSGDADHNENNNKDSDIDKPSPQPVSKLRLVTRSEWIAQPPNKQNPKLKIPINRVIITHTATEGCYTQAQCVFRVRMIQSYHMDSKLWDDIGYNFLVGGDGSVYEGRGWHIQGAHTQHYNADSIGIAFIGTFTIKPPPPRQFEAFKLLLEEGVLTGNLTNDYTMYPHCAFITTDSPGVELMKVIKSWPHYIGKLKFDCSKNSSEK